MEKQKQAEEVKKYHEQRFEIARKNGELMSDKQREVKKVLFILLIALS